MRPVGQLLPGHLLAGQGRPAAVGHRGALLRRRLLAQHHGGHHQGAEPGGEGEEAGGSRRAGRRRGGPWKFFKLIFFLITYITESFMSLK